MGYRSRMVPTWPASDLRALEVRDQNKLWDFTTFAHSDFIEVCCYSGSYLGLKEYEEKLVGQWKFSECHKVSRRKYVPMWCPEPACLKQENTEFSYFEDSALKRKNALLCGPAGLRSALFRISSGLAWLGVWYGARLHLALLWISDPVRSCFLAITSSN